MKKTILIADDERNMRLLIADFLKQSGFQILEAANGEEAWTLFQSNSLIDLVILDVMMPLMNGWQVTEKIREVSSVPIIILTAKNQEKDELYGFHKGADEFIKKPFSPSILVARVNTLLKRTSLHTSPLFERGILKIDFDKVTVHVENQRVYLSKTLFQLLGCLIEHEGKVLSREQIINHVWGFDYEGTGRTVDTHINRLRILLGTAGNYVQTLRGFGYRFEVTT